MTTKSYLRKGSAPYVALKHLQVCDGVETRAGLIGAVMTVTPSETYADEVIGRLIQRGYVETSMVRLTASGLEALEACELRYVTQRPKQGGAIEFAYLLSLDVIALAAVGLFAAAAGRLFFTVNDGALTVVTRVLCAIGGAVFAYAAWAFFKDHPWVQCLRNWWQDIQEPFDIGD